MTFQVLGHMKTLCVLTLGWLLFDLKMTAKNVLGMIVAVVGMVYYSWAVEADKQQPDCSKKVISVSSTKVEQMKLLNSSGWSEV